MAGKTGKGRGAVYTGGYSNGFGPSEIFKGNGGGFFSGLGNFFKSPGFGNAIDLGSLALNAYGLNKSLGFAEDQLNLLEDQEQRAATAQNFSTANSLALGLQMTTPGTPEHERIKQAIASGQYSV